MGGAANGILVVDGGFIQKIPPDIERDQGIGRSNPLAQISPEIPVLEWAGICRNRFRRQDMKIGVRVGILCTVNPEIDIRGGGVVSPWVASVIVSGCGPDPFRF